MTPHSITGQSPTLLLMDWQPGSCFDLVSLDLSAQVTTQVANAETSANIKCCERMFYVWDAVKLIFKESPNGCLGFLKNS